MAYIPEVLNPTAGGTGVANASSSTITLGGALTTSGAYASTFTMTNTTAVTFPTSGTLATTSQLPSITATQYDVLVGGAANAIVSVGPGSAGQVLQSGGNASNPAYSTPTYPSASGTSRTILVSNGTNNIYSTETWATPGTSGNILTSNGTNWTSAAPATSGTVTSVTGTSNQVSVATGTTTPVISLVGPYTPATYTTHGILVGEGTSSIVALAAGSAGQVVLSGGASADPGYVTPTAGSGLSVTTNATTLSYNIANYTDTTYTPALSFGGSTTGVTYTTQYGRYTQIGNMVFFNVNIVLSSKGSQTGNIGISLPVTSANVTTKGIVAAECNCTLPASTNSFVGEIQANSTNMAVVGVGSATLTTVTNTQASNTSIFRFSGMYWTT